MSAIKIYSQKLNIGILPQSIKDLIVVDLGNTNIRVGVANFIKQSDSIHITRLHKERIVGKGANKQLSLLLEIIDEIIYESKIIPNNILVSFGGIVYADGTLEAPFHDGWKNINLRKLLSERHKIKDSEILIINDANSAGIGEYMFGAGKNIKSPNMNFFLVSTGIGGALILNEKLFTGDNGLAGEHGYLTYDQHKEKGKWKDLYGTTIGYASGTAIAEMAIKVAKQDNKFLSELKNLKLINDVNDITAKTIFTAKYHNIKKAEKIYNFIIDVLATNIANVSNLLDINNTVMGGGISLSSKVFIKDIEIKAKEKIMPEKRDKMKIYQAELGDNAGIVGTVAAYLSSQ